MARFFVGQPVRIKCPESVAGHHGKETRISRIDVLVTGVHSPTRFVGHEVMLRSLNPFIPWCVYTEDELIPITPDGHQAGEEGRCKPLDHLLSRLKGVEA